MSDSIGIPGDIFGIFGGGPSATTPSTVATDGGTNPTNAGPSAAPISGADVTKIGTAVIGGIEDVAHGFGLGPGSAATQAREAAAAQAAAQQQLLFAGIAALVVVVVLYKMGYTGGAP